MVMMVNDRINPIPCFSARGPVDYDGHGKFPCPLYLKAIEQGDAVYFFRMIDGVKLQQGNRQFGLRAMHAKCIEEMYMDTQYME
jgi:hypothetical protein